VRIPFRIPAADAHTFDVVGFGLNSVDLLAVVAEYPASNSKQRLQRFARLPGGQIATAVAACARLGWRSRYIGSFGDDDLGALSRASLTQEGVDITAARTVAGATNQFAVILVDGRSGDRTVLWDRHPGLTMGGADVLEQAVTSGRMLIVDCHETAAASQAARYARAAGIPTVIDVEKVRPGIADLLQQIDAIVAAQAFPTELTGYDEPGRALEAMAYEFGTPVVCVTLGAEGSLARCNGREVRTPAFPVDCVDSTGAGDVFRGAFAAGCLARPDGDIEDVLEYANAAAALNCRALGARGGMPRAEEVEQLVDAHRRM
jgi:sulfofructose kinase